MTDTTFGSVFPYLIDVVPRKSVTDLPFAGNTPLDPPLQCSGSTVQILRPFFLTPTDAGDAPECLLDRARRILAHEKSLKLECLRARIKSLPPTIEAYGEWYERICPFAERQWREQGIYKAIKSSTEDIEVREGFLTTMMCFWDSSINGFLFPHGMMSPTLLDVALLARLPVAGQDAATICDDDAPSHTIHAREEKSGAPYGWFIDANRGEPGSPVSVSEHAAFLLCWLKRYIFCSGSKCILFHHTDLACLLASGRRVALGTLFLADLYKGINKFVERTKAGVVSSTSISGPIWFLEVWFRLYFSLGKAPGRRVEFPVDSSVTPLATVMASTSHIQKLGDLVKAILFRPLMDDRFFPYQHCLHLASFPLWPDTTRSFPFEDRPFTREDTVSWDSITRPRHLLGSRFMTSKVWVTAEPYMPQCFARQFGCCQGIYAELTLANLSPEKTVEGSVTREDAASYAIRIQSYLVQQSILSFRLHPCSLSTVPVWWVGFWREHGRSIDHYLTTLGTDKEVVAEKKKKNGKAPTSAAPPRSPKLLRSSKKRKDSEIMQPSSPNKKATGTSKTPIVILGRFLPKPSHGPTVTPRFLVTQVGMSPPHLSSKTRFLRAH